MHYRLQHAEKKKKKKPTAMHPVLPCDRFVFSDYVNYRLWIRKSDLIHKRRYKCRKNREREKNDGKQK